MMQQATKMMHTNRNNIISRIPIMIAVTTSESNPEFESSPAVVGVAVMLISELVGSICKVLVFSSPLPSLEQLDISIKIIIAKNV